MGFIIHTLQAFLRGSRRKSLPFQHMKRVCSNRVVQYSSKRHTSYFMLHRNYSYSFKTQSSSCSLFYVSFNRFCHQNTAVSSRKVINYFNLLNIAQQFDVDDTVLRAQFQEKMKEFHPDKFATKSEQEKKDAERISIQLNRARTILESPLFRAQHLLSLMNTKQTDEMIDDQFQILDQDFLFEIMEIRTTVESTKDHAILQNILDENSKLMKHTIKDIASQFKLNMDHKNGDYSIPQPNIDSIRQLLAKLTYFHRIEGEIKEKLPSRE